MKKVSAFILISLLFSLVSFSHAKSEVRGNTIGNIANYGSVVESGNYVYYSCDGLYKESKDGANKTKICDFNADNLNIIGDYLYCRLFLYNSDKYQNSGIYKIKTDGSVLQKLSTDEADYMNVVGDYIYYANASDKYKPYKMKIDGTGRRKMNDYPMSNLNVTGDWIYFENHVKNASLYKMKTDGTKMTLLCDLSAYRMEINVIEDWIYFVADYPNTGLYKVKTDGTQLKKISGAQLSGLNVVGDTIYYAVYRDGIYKMKTDGTGSKLVVKTDTMGINIANGWIYYTSYDGGTLDFDNTSFNKVNFDGSKLVRIYTSKSSVNNVKSVINNSGFSYIINGKYESLASDISIINKTYLLPLNELTKLGIPGDSNHINYNKTDNSITINHNNTQILLYIDSNILTVNNKKQSLDAAPFINSDGTVFVPAQAIAEAVGKVLQIDTVGKAIIICDKAQFDQVRDILSKSDKAMNSLISYKSKSILKYTSTKNDMHENCVYDYEVDKEHKQLKIFIKIVSDDGNQEYDFYLSDGTAYVKNSDSSSWTKAEQTREQYESNFQSLNNIYELNSDVLCAGLQIQKNSDGNHFVLKGDILFSDLYYNAGYGIMLSERGNPEYTLEIAVDKQTYFIKEIKMNMKRTIDKEEYDLSNVITYNSFNDRIIILPPDVTAK